MIGHNSWTDWAREPLKTSLDSDDSKESNELDKNVPLHLTFLRKIHICIFAILIFWQFSEQIKLLVPCIPFLIHFCALLTSDEPSNTIFQKKWVRNVLSADFGGKEGWVGLVDFQMLLWEPEKISAGNYLICFLKWSRSKQAAVETLISLLTHGVREKWPKTDTKTSSTT